LENRTLAGNGGETKKFRKGKKVHVKGINGLRKKRRQVETLQKLGKTGGVRRIEKDDHFLFVERKMGLARKGADQRTYQESSGRSLLKGGMEEKKCKEPMIGKWKKGGSKASFLFISGGKGR